ncbi:hypothetical protein ACFLRQ_01630 [Bacteroidota bacterium]
MKKLSHILILVLFTTNSCYYSDLDTHEVEIQNNAYSPSISIKTNLDTMENIIFSDSLFFRYEIEIDTGRLYVSDLYLDNIQFFRSDTVVDSLFIIPGSLFYDGNYELTMLAYYKTYSGSLADILDAEFFIKDTSWIITIKRDDI